jgi:hypothetical protein
MRRRVAPCGDVRARCEERALEAIVGSLRRLGDRLRWPIEVFAEMPERVNLGSDLHEH